MARTARTITIILAFLLMALPAMAQTLLDELNAADQGAEVELPSAHVTEATFDLPANPRSVQLYLQAILRFRAASHSAGVLRIAINDRELGPEHSANKAAEYCQAGTGPYAPRSWALPAQPEFATGEREDLGGLGYLFDISDLARAGRNTLRISHAAATDAVLLRGVSVIVGGERLPIELSTARMDVNDPEKLAWDFGPNISEGKGLFLCEGMTIPVQFRPRNTDTTGAMALGMELELPAGVTLLTPWLPAGTGWTDQIAIEERAGDGAATVYTLKLPDDAVVGPETDWTTFAGHPLTLYLRCEAGPGAYTMRWRSLSQGGEGMEVVAPLTVLPAPADAPQPGRSRLGVWAYTTVSASASEPEAALRESLRAETYARLQQVGVSRMILSEADEIPPARDAGMLVSLASPWGFNRTVFPSDTTDPEKARYDADGQPIFADRYSQAMQWCPTYAAENVAEVFGPITERIRDEGWEGFDLDHEGVHQQCFCERCRSAFAEHAGLVAADLDWPAAVQEDGPLHERWLDFHVWNIGRHVAAIREAVKAGDPDALLYSWFTMSLYERAAEGPHAEVYRGRIAEEREYGYDIAQFLPSLDIADMANGVYPHGEDTWDYQYGLTWAFNRVEATVDNPWDVPLAPCLNIGSGTGGTWTNPDYLRWQAKTHIAQGVQGLDFWVLPFFDGRHFALLSDLARLLEASEPFAWEGERADDRVAVEGPEGIFHRAFATGDRVLVGITNRTLEPVQVTLTPAQGLANAREVLTGAELGGQLTVPALDGVFVIYDAQ